MTRETRETVNVPRLAMKVALANAIWMLDRNETTNARVEMCKAQAILTEAAAAPTPLLDGQGSRPQDAVVPTEGHDATVVGMLAEIVEACQPIAEKARRWDQAHGADRRDSVQIEHRIGDFRRIRDLLDRKSCAADGCSSNEGAGK